KDGKMIPLGTLVKITPTVGPSLISLYNLRPTATIIDLPAQGVSSGQALTLMEEIARRTLPPGTGFEWSAMSYQERLVGNQMYIVFGLALLLVYLVLRRAIRELVCAALGHSGGAAVVHRAGDSALGADREWAQQQSLCSDRARAPDGAFGQERDPDRRTRARAARGGANNAGSGH